MLHSPALKAVGVCHVVSLFTTTPAKRNAGAADTRKVAKRLAAWPCGLASADGVTVFIAHAAWSYMAGSVNVGTKKSPPGGGLGEGSQALFDAREF